MEKVIDLSTWHGRAVVIAAAAVIIILLILIIGVALPFYNSCNYSLFSFMAEEKK